MYKYGKKLFCGGDPFILKHNNAYYIYCTTENELPAFTEEYPFFETYKNGSDGIEVYRSQDLRVWENLGWCLEKGRDIIGEHGFWAPEVSYYDGKFYMVYAVDEKIAVAVSEKPEGPFVKITDGYLIDGRAIDGHLLFDDDGRIYLYYCCPDKGNHIRVAEMSQDLTCVKKYYDRKLIAADSDWETVDCTDDGTVAEGPFVIKHKGIYYLSYSANHTRCKEYAVGYATSDSPLGPFVKFEGNPILHKFDDIEGTGHHSFMPTENENKYICVYHCHGGSISGFKPRKICLAEAEFVKSENGIDRLTICQ